MKKIVSEVAARMPFKEPAVDFIGANCFAITRICSPMASGACILMVGGVKARLPIFAAARSTSPAWCLAEVKAFVKSGTTRTSYEYSGRGREAIVQAHPRAAHSKEEIIRASYDGIKHKPETTFGKLKADVFADKDPNFTRGNFCSVIRESAWRW
jgi:hypothetical protein